MRQQQQQQQGAAGGVAPRRGGGVEHGGRVRVRVVRDLFGGLGGRGVFGAAPVWSPATLRVRAELGEVAVEAGGGEVSVVQSVHVLRGEGWEGGRGGVESVTKSAVVSVCHRRLQNDVYNNKMTRVGHCRSSCAYQPEVGSGVFL